MHRQLQSLEKATKRKTYGMHLLSTVLLLLLLLLPAPWAKSKFHLNRQYREENEQRQNQIRLNISEANCTDRTRCICIFMNELWNAALARHQACDCPCSAHHSLQTIRMRQCIRGVHKFIQSSAK